MWLGDLQGTSLHSTGYTGVPGSKWEASGSMCAEGLLYRTVFVWNFKIVQRLNCGKKKGNLRCVVWRRWEKV